MRALLQFNKKILENKALYVCFRRGPEGEEIAGLFRQGMGRIDAEKIFSTSLEALMRDK